MKRQRVQKLQRPTEAAPGRHVTLLTCVGLLILIACLYGQVFHNEFINYDDPVYVTDNSHVLNGLTANGLSWAFTTATDANWFPLTWISHMLDVQLFGIQAGPQHLVNVVLHALSTLLLFGLLKRMTGAQWPSAFVAFLFALHPLHVESVAWIAERKDVLSALFWFMTLWAYVEYTRNRSTGKYLLVMVFFACGLMSKPMIVTLPFVLLLLDLWPLRRKAILEKIPLFAMSLAAAIVTLAVQKHGGSVVSIDAVPLAARIQNAFVTYFIYLGKTLWPSNLAVLYPDIPAYQLWQWLGSALGLMAITALVVRERQRRPYLAVGWLWFLGTLVPVIGLVQVGVQSRADRYMYIPMVGISILLAWGIAELSVRYNWRPIPLAIGTALACAAYSAITWNTIGYWQNSVTLFEHAVSVTDGNWVAYNNLGAALRHDARIPEAIAAFEKGLAIHPDQAPIQNNLGEGLMSTRNIDSAIPRFQEAIRLQPNFAKAHINLGSAFMMSGKPKQAEAEFRIGVQLQPDDAEARYALGAALREQNRLPEALPYLESALPLLSGRVAQRPDDTDARFNLAVLFELVGKREQAVTQFAEIVRLQPQDAEVHFRLGVDLSALQRYDEAIAEFSEALRLKPDFSDAKLGLDDAIACKRRLPKR